MPRPKKSTAEAKIEKKPKRLQSSTSTKRTRRSPYELVQELKAKRDDLYERMTGQIAKLDRRIVELEAKHEHKIKVSELVSSKSPEELEREFEDMRKQQALLRKALKQLKK